MIKPIILAKGSFNPEDLIVTISESNRKIDIKKEKQLHNLYKEKEKKALERGQHIYNGFSYRLNSLNFKENKLLLDFSIFDFKTRECLIETEGYYNLPEEYWRKGCYTSATVKTSDGKYLMVELSGKSMNTNKVDYLGGIMETEPPIQSGKDIFDSLYAELEEEAFIKKADILEAHLKLIFISARTNVGFYFEILLKNTSEQVTKRFDNQIKEIDIKSLKIMSRTDYISELENHANVSKQFLAAHIDIF